MQALISIITKSIDFNLIKWYHSIIYLAKRKGLNMIRRATMSDAPAILELVNYHAEKGLMLKKCPYDIYRSIQAFFVYEEDGKVVGCARVAVAWKDLVEIASLAVHKDYAKRGIGRALVEKCLERAKQLHVPKAFSLTYQCEFFSKCGFHEVDRDTLPHKVFGDCLNCAKVECCDEHAFVIDLPLD